MGRQCLAWVGLLLVALVACGDPVPASLIDHDRWQTGTATADPWASHAPAPVSCSPAAYGVEGTGPDRVFEIETDSCDFFGGEQPSLVEVAAGQEIHFVLWHLGLFNPAAAEAHVGIGLDSRVLWETTLPIPSDEVSFDHTLEAPADARRGAPVTFHLHNHGANSWRLQRLEVLQ